ncbi:hypothetical protein ARMSODRAFT_1023784 [Armillaria solidipes]|uniref:Uncharacterized protein n=1 Tax=Armillaria solidipes TaxID=1076256 RepID=A0A2H3AY05_9AGAR|nr:hypothetical protein ARMSODRAFT_1023784 [Armillaria solidipes]
MAGSSVPPSSVSSFRASSHTRSSMPLMPSKNQRKPKAEHMQESQSFSPSSRSPTSGTSSFMENEPDYDVEVTTKMMTTVTMTVHRSATPQPHTPSLYGSRKHLTSPPTSPLRGKVHRPHSEHSTSELSSTSTTCTPVSDPAYTPPSSPSK